MKLSIRWLAIDSFDHKVFSERSDIWSFAVTMWELFTNGQQPFTGEFVGRILAYTFCRYLFQIFIVIVNGNS